MKLLSSFKMSINAISTAILISAACAYGSHEIAGLNVQHRYPWNGLVDISFDLALDPVDADAMYQVGITAKKLDGDVVLPVSSVTSPDGTCIPSAPISPGSYNFIWDVGTDAPGLDFANVEITVSATKVQPTYLVVDLAGGPSAASYPVSQLYSEPAGGFNTDEYKTTKLVLRRLPAGTFKFGGSSNVTFSNDSYAGLFEVTQAQWAQVMGNNPSHFQGAKHPVDQVSYNMLRGISKGVNWPSSNDVDPDSFFGKLRSRTGVVFDLPTEAQWEYACRAGTTTAYSYGNDASGANMWFDENSGYQTHDVSLTPANPWGLFDMHGNVLEWCLDWEGANPSGTDPKGAQSGSKRMMRGGSWISGENDCASAARTSCYPSYDEDYDNNGFRVFSAPKTAADLVSASASTTLDTHVGIRTARSIETILYSTEWTDGDDVVISLDGDPLFNASAPTNGTIEIATEVWRSPGLHTLIHDNGTTVLTAQFNVPADDFDPYYTDALGDPDVSWTTSEGIEWRVIDNVQPPYVRSAPIGTDTESVLETTINGPCDVSFDWMASYDAAGQSLKLFVDGVAIADMPGADWSTVSFKLKAGEHALRFAYAKDSSDEDGDDYGAIRNFAYGFHPTLVVRSAYGVPSPHVGRSVFQADEQVAASVTAPSPVDNTRFVCTGWTGTGSVPECDAETNEVAFAIHEDSTLTWTWTTNYWLSLTIVDDTGRTTSAFEDRWVKIGEKVEIPFEVDAPFYDCALSGDSNGATIKDGIISVPAATMPRAITLTVAPHTYEDALDSRDITWESGGDAVWVVPSATTHDGIDAATSGEVIDGGRSILTATFTGPRVLTWWWKLDNSDLANVEVYLDGDIDFGDGLEDGLWETTDWTQAMLKIDGDDKHRVDFVFWNFGTSFNKADAAYLDQVTWATDTEPPVPYSWLIDNGIVDPDADDAVFEAAPYELAADGMHTVLECYENDLDPNADYPYVIVRSEHGEPEPHIGRIFYEPNATVKMSMKEPDPVDGTKYVCTGWTGTGDVPANGTGTNVTFTIGNSSTITWNWTTNYWLSLTIVDDSGRTTSAFDDRWVKIGEKVEIPFEVDAPFNNSMLGGDTDGVTIADGIISVPAATMPRAIILTVTPYTYAGVLGTHDIEWTSGGDSVWVVPSSESHDGHAAAKSGSVSDNGISTLSATFTGPTKLSWWWKLNMSDSCGVNVFLDDEHLPKENVNGLWEKGGDWIQADLDIIESGEHTVRFEFWNDGSGDSANDAAYIAQVSLGQLLSKPMATKSWMIAHGLANEDDNEATLIAKANAKAANKVNTVNECYFAGIDPNGPDEQLLAQIEIVNGKPVISWTPERPATTPEEWYKVEGKANLADKEWAPKADGHRFFRVRIVIPDSL